MSVGIAETRHRIANLLFAYHEPTASTSKRSPHCSVQRTSGSPPGLLRPGRSRALPRQALERPLGQRTT